MTCGNSGRSLLSEECRSNVTSLLRSTIDSSIRFGSVRVFICLLTLADTTGVGRVQLYQLARQANRSTWRCKQHLVALMHAGLLRMKLVSERDFVYDFRLVLNADGPSLT